MKEPRPRCGTRFASKLHIDDLRRVLPKSDSDYSMPVRQDIGKGCVRLANDDRFPPRNCESREPCKSGKPPAPIEELTEQ